MDPREFNELTDKLREQAESVGLYLRGAQVQTTAAEFDEEEEKSIQDLMAEGEEFMIQAHFQLGEVAFSQRIQDPDAFDEEIAFRVAAPSETEMEAARILDLLKSGKFTEDDDDPEGD